MRFRSRELSRFFLPLFGLLLLVRAGSSKAATWYIKADGFGDAPTIQAGVDSAAAGDTVLVGPGTYADTTHVSVLGELRPVNVVIKKNVVLVSSDGEASTTIDVRPGDVGFYAVDLDSTAEIKGFRFFGDPVGFGCFNAGAEPETAAPFLQTAILAVNSTCVIAENKTDNVLIGARLDASNATVRHNIFYQSAYGIECANWANADIFGNTFGIFSEGVRCVNASPVICANDFDGGDPTSGCTGVACYGGRAVIVGNKFGNTANYGIVGGGAGLTIEGNTFGRHVWSGISLSGTEPCAIRQNIFTNSGIDLTYGRGVVVEQNTFVGTGVAIQFGAVIRHNIIVGASDGIICELGSIVECNNVFDTQFAYPLCDSSLTGSNGNISVDPEFCGVPGSGNYFLQSDSPCAPGNHPDGTACGLIGAFPVNCGTIPVKKMTWGELKSRFSSQAGAE